VLVVVLAVSRMAAPVVHIIDVIPVRDRDMATPVTVDVVMTLVHRMAGCLTFVVVILVLSVKVTVVHEVDVIPVRDRDMAASFAVHMFVFDVLVVDCAGHCCSPPYRVRFTSYWRIAILVTAVGRHQVQMGERIRLA
jgi:hypothetical protein